MATILDKIAAYKREEVARAKIVIPQAQLESLAKHAPSVRSFHVALQNKIAEGQWALIAEIKRASPSVGEFRARLGGSFDPIAYAESYERHGATCLSVLTDREYFQGSVADLVAARAACSLPVIRKDFIIDPYQIVEARAMGADAVLFIMGAVDISHFRAWEKLANSMGLAVLAEAHNEDELNQALTLETPLIGINNRDLTRFVTDIGTTLRLVPHVPATRILITESGVDCADVASRLTAHGVRTFLIGGALLGLPDPGAGLKTLFPRQLL